MTAKQKRGFNWTIGAIIALAGIIWGASAWATDNDTLDALQTEQIKSCEVKSIEAITISIENRTRATIMAARVEELESRVSDLEDLEDMVEDIHHVIVGGD